MNEETSMAGDTRLSVSLAQLRAELTSMELRIVDRLNGALANKADRAVLEQVAQRSTDNQSRLTLLEREALRRDGPIIHEHATAITDLQTRLSNLSEVGKYKRWLWAQTVALVAIAVPMIVYAIDRVSP